MDDKILAALSRVNPANWKDMEGFSSAGFTRDTGLALEYLQPNLSDEKMADFIKRINELAGTSRGVRSLIYLAAYEGSRYLDSTFYPFPKPSLTNAALPLMKASEVGQVVIPLKGVIMGLNDPQAVLRVVGPTAQNNYSLPALRTLAQKVKQILPDVQTGQIMNYLAYNGALVPDVRNQVIAVMDEVFSVNPTLANIPQMARPAVN